MQLLPRGRWYSSNLVSAANARSLSDTKRRSVARHSVKATVSSDVITSVSISSPSDASLCDALTGLVGRAYLDELLAQLVRSSVEQAFAVLFVDLDRFKRVNDSLGHQAGDEVLKVAASRLRDAVRDGDVVARFGGDEFVIVMPDIQSVAVTTKIAKRVVAVLNDPIHIGGRLSGVGASVGIALSDGSSSSADILRQADMALYEAKARGRGRHVIFDHRLAEQADRRMDVESAVRSSVELGCLDVHFQPIVSLVDGTAVGIEALARLDHPEIGVVSPAEFVPLASELGLMGPIGRWLRHYTFDKHRQFRPEAHLSLNLSGTELERPSLIEEILEDAEGFGIDPSRVCFEISEDILIHEKMKSLRTLKRLRDLGFLLSLDDFGTGQASLTAFRAIDVDEVKIDRSFVSGVEENAVDRSICHAVTVLAKGAGARVVAEGIETEGQFNVLQEMGVDFGQGYLFGKPEPLI